ncbi:hypothetical protein SAMN04487948_11430 [Halogranum amylolyticum]|uniref:L-alanine-DL-glutamate epimerase n=1 Tax=Halogranum amylolyticum TaxID=660520 RepID=A0A1H8V474_9EURY|nr:hypothetical protein [Halogranum amylolyticum]SEP10229.1 hypothetical protein SAMN04487948_11430 [Halogranum amylolyticum]
MTLYDHVAGLPLSIAANDRTSRRREMADGRVRVTSTFALLSGETFGAGEDVTYDVVDHEALPKPPVFDFTGEYTFDEFSRSLDELDLFPEKPPEREESRNYRRWALESAALDLALKQNDETLASLLDRERSPVRFVASTPVPDGDTTRVQDILTVNPACEFKLDPTEAWTKDTFTTLAETGAVRVLDLRGQDEMTADDGPSLATLYRRIFETFPDAIIEDPTVTDDVQDLLPANVDRISWDAPVHCVDDLRERPFAPRWCNVKPSRFGTVRSLFETIEYCEAEDIQMYGGGQSELCVGRGHIQLLASLFYPDSPNDVAPRSYNEPDVRAELRASPLEPPANPAGMEWTQLD